MRCGWGKAAAKLGLYLLDELRVENVGDDYLVACGGAPDGFDRVGSRCGDQQSQPQPEPIRSAIG